MRTQKNPAMSKFYKALSVIALVLIGTVVSCSKDDNNTVPLRDYNEQYVTDITAIDDFIDHYSMAVSPDFDVTFTKITAQNPGTPLRNQSEFNLQVKYVKVDDHNITSGDVGHENEYKVYYISLREGANENPSYVDSAYVSYKGVTIDNDTFDQTQNPSWFRLYETVKGWQEIVPLFKTGFYTSGGGPDPVSFTDFGAGVLFIPSGLGYYNQPKANIPSYSPLIFNFKLFELNHIDHDLDGILSKDEVTSEFPDPADYDSDGDGTANLFDVDDDGDGIMTKYELHRDSSGNIIFEDCDNDTIPNYLDADSNGQTCN